MPAPLLRQNSWVAHGRVGAGEEGSDRQRGEDGDGAATRVSSLVYPAYSSWSKGREVVDAGREEISGLHSCMGPAPGAIGEGLSFRVRNRNPEAVAALLGSPGKGEKLPMLQPRSALVFIEEMRFSNGKTSLAYLLLGTRDSDVLVTRGLRRLLFQVLGVGRHSARLRLA